jgi:hypothetical protein
MAVVLLSVSRVAMRRMIMLAIVRLVERQGLDLRRLARRVLLVAAGVAVAWVACVALVVALAIHFL